MLLNLSGQVHSDAQQSTKANQGKEMGYSSITKSVDHHQSVSPQQRMRHKQATDEGG